MNCGTQIDVDAGSPSSGRHSQPLGQSVVQGVEQSLPPGVVTQYPDWQSPSPVQAFPKSGR
jgi:hypothetical protein